MSKIKEASQFTNGAWSTPTPIGADDANIDITSATTNPTDSTATADGLIAADVTASSGDTDASAWTKFNRFRKRVYNSFSSLAGKTLATAYTISDAENKVYSASVLNSYMSNVVGYSGTTAPSEGTVASQLSSLNDNKVSKSGDTMTGPLITTGISILMGAPYGQSAERYVLFRDQTNTINIGSVIGLQTSTGHHIVSLRPSDNNATDSNYLNLGFDNNHKPTVALGSPTTWRKALGIPSYFTTSTTSMTVPRSQNRFHIIITSGGGTSTGDLFYEQYGTILVAAGASEKAYGFIHKAAKLTYNITGAQITISSPTTLVMGYWIL